MVRSALAAAALLLASHALAQNCDLGSPSSQASCPTSLASDGTATCTLTVTNKGTAACSGTWAGAWGTLDPGTVTNVRGTGVFSSCSSVGTVPLPFGPFMQYTQLTAAWDAADRISRCNRGRRRR